METTTVQFNDTLVLDGSQIIDVENYHAHNRREIIEVMYNNNLAYHKAGYEAGYTVGISVGIVTTILFIIGWRLLKNYFNHKYENKPEQKSEA